MLLEDVPVDVQKIIIKKTSSESENCKCHRPQDYALWKVVREWDGVLGAEDGQLVICYAGQFFPVEIADIDFVGDRVYINCKIPITSGVGALLNYRRINGE